MKTRSDKGGTHKKPKFYGGKPVKKKRINKSGNFVPYVSKRNKFDDLKVMFHEWCDLPYDSYMRIPKHLRARHNKRCFRIVKIDEYAEKPYLALINPNDLSTPEKIGETAINLIGYAGIFDIRLPTKRKNKFHCSFCKKAGIIITEHEEGLRASVKNYHKMSRYWFFKGK